MSSTHKHLAPMPPLLPLLRLPKLPHHLLHLHLRPSRQLRHHRQRPKKVPKTFQKTVDFICLC